MRPMDAMPKVELHCGDCLDVLRGMEADSVDAIVTDPPFGIGFNYSGKREVASDPESYWRWLRPIHDEWVRVLRPGGFMAVWNAHKNFRHFWDWFGADIRIYAACKNFVQLRNDPINLNGYDPVVMRYKAGAEPLRPAKQARSVNFFVANTAGIISDKTRIEKGHPCPRPLDQVIAVVENFTLPGGVVLDPFLGSGTTALACLQTGRDIVGIEIDAGYHAITRRRIDAALAEQPLFTPLGA